MKILVLNYEYPPIGGGAGVITQNISERLARLGHQVTVVTTWHNNEKEIGEAGDLKIIRLKSGRKYLHKSSIPEMLAWINASSKFLKTYCSAQEFDLCIANFAIPGGVVALSLKKRFGLKYCIISHGHDIPWMFPKQMRFFHVATYFKIKRICIEAEANFVQTETMKQNIDKFLGKKYVSKNILIPNGIDTRLFKPDYTKRSTLFKIVFIGRLVEQKDPFTFLKAIKSFSEKHIDFIVHILGDGILRKSMEEYVNSNGINNNVKFFGWVSKEDMVKEYQSAHINVVTSVFEGMSIAVFESLACGCFLITTPLPGTHDVITPNENAVIVNFSSPSEVAKQLEDYYTSKFLKNYKVTDSVVNDLITRYNWDKIVAEYENKFKQLLGVSL